MKNIARERERVARLRERDKLETCFLDIFGVHTTLINRPERENRTRRIILNSGGPPCVLIRERDRSWLVRDSPQRLGTHVTYNLF